MPPPLHPPSTHHQAKYIELETRKDGVKFTSKGLRAAAERLQALRCVWGVGGGG